MTIMPGELGLLTTIPRALDVFTTERADDQGSSDLDSPTEENIYV